MNSVFIAFVLRFIVLILIQIMLIDQADLGIYLFPMVYPLIFLRIPMEFNKSALLAIVFFVGLSIDIFHYTPGLHVSACLTTILARFYLLKLISPRDGYEINASPSIKDMGGVWFLTYIITLIFIHHTWFFVLEALDISLLPHILVKILLSVVATTTLTFIIHILGSNTKT